MSHAKIPHLTRSPRNVGGEGKDLDGDEWDGSERGGSEGDQVSVYLFDMEGDPVAFRRSWSDPHVFDLRGRRIGCLPWDDNDVVDLDGRYLGTVVDDRLVRRNDSCQRPCSSLPDDPGPVEPTGRPLTPHYFPNRFAYEDIPVLRRA